MEPASALSGEPIELMYEDGIPMDSPWHRSQMNLLIDLTHQHWHGRNDYYTGGNMFVYFSLEQARRRDYRGPDYFTVVEVDGTRERKAWVVWEEDGRYPDIIVELLSESTRDEDLGPKKRIYEKVFRTPEFFCYDRDRREILGWRLERGRYKPIAADERGWMWSEVLQAFLGLWEGEFQKQETLWLRLYDRDGRLVPTPAEAERRRAEAAMAEAESLRARLRELEDRRRGA